MIAHFDFSLSVIIPMQRINSTYCDQRTAMNAHKHIGKFLFQRFERLVDQVFATVMMHANILLVSMQSADLVDRNQF